MLAAAPGLQVGRADPGADDEDRHEHLQGEDLGGQAPAPRVHPRHTRHRPVGVAMRNSMNTTVTIVRPGDRL